MEHQALFTQSLTNVALLAAQCLPTQDASPYPLESPLHTRSSSLAMPTLLTSLPRYR